jgi:hypothetical protein
MKLRFKVFAIYLAAVLIFEPLSAAAAGEDSISDVTDITKYQSSSENGFSNTLDISNTSEAFNKTCSSEIIATADVADRSDIYTETQVSESIATADVADVDIKHDNISTLDSDGSQYAAETADNYNELSSKRYRKLSKVAAISEDDNDVAESNSDNIHEDELTGANELSLDALTAWVNDNPDKLGSLYNGDTTIISSLSKDFDVSEEVLNDCISDLKAQNDIIVQVITNGDDVLNTISSCTVDESASQLGVSEVAIELFKIKVNYVTNLINEEIKSAEANGSLTDESEKLGKALGDEDNLKSLAATFDVEPAVLSVILEDMGIEPIVTTSLKITNVELDIPDGVNDTFTYTIFLYSTSASGYVSAITGTYGNTTFESKRLYYSTAYSYGLPYNGYYTYFGYTQVALSAGGSVKIPDLPDGCNYVILVSASESYYVKSIEATYGKIDNQIATVSVSGANGPNKVTCTNDYAPHSLRLSEEVMSNDPDSVNDEFTFKIYLYQHGSSENTPLFSGDSVKVNIRTDGVDGAEAPDLGATLTFTTTESISLTGLSIPGTYNVAEVTLKHGQSIVLEDLGSDYGCYIAQVPVCHYMLYTLKSRQVYTYSPIGYTGSYNNYYNYINECNVSSSVGFVNAQETISITKQVKNSDTTRKFVFNVYLLQYLPDTSTYTPMREGTFNLTYTNPTGDEPKTVDIKLRDDIVKNSTFTDSQTGQKYTVQMSVAQVEVAAGQTVTIEDLPTAVCYYIEEVPVDNYVLTAATASGSGATITNSYDIYDTLSLADEVLTFTNTYVEPDGNDLSISKTVTGSLGDTKRSFEFNVTLNDENNSPLSNEDIQVVLPGTTNATMYTTDNDGNIKVNLKHGDTVVLQNLLQGTSFTITETDADDYTTSFSVDGNSSQESANHSQSGSMTNGKDVAVSVTNDKKLIVPTGIKVEALPYVIILMFSGITLVIAISKKRRKTSL